MTATQRALCCPHARRNWTLGRVPDPLRERGDGLVTLLLLGGMSTISRLLPASAPPHH